MVHLNKSRLWKGVPTKLQMRRVGPCKILAKYGHNAYKVDLPNEVSMSPIFNVADLVPFKGELPSDSQRVSDLSHSLSDLSLPSSSTPIPQQVLDSRIIKKTRDHTYMEHLIKWKDKPVSEATWIPKSDFLKAGIPLSLLSKGVT